MSDSDPPSQISVEDRSSPPSITAISPNEALALAHPRFAFLNHSALTLPRNLPPNVDNKPLARQRRRRTSPEDAAILESEFQRNSKPNRIERGRIADRVALGEKEVQIWFQNRRSTTRRRALPIIYPIAQDSSLAIDSSFQGSSSPPQIYETANIDAAAALRRHEETEHLSAAPLNSTECHQHDTVSTNHNVGESIEILPRDLEGDAIASTKTSTLESTAPHGSRSDPRTKERPTILAPQATPCSLKRKPSGVRLSMSSDGGALVLGENESTPSPPRPSPGVQDFGIVPKRSPSLRRSSSMTDLKGTTLVARSSHTNLVLRRQTSGRSRDSRAWEFWCDSEARRELSRKAEQDQAGSAIDAISTMRSQAHATLKPLNSKDIWASHPSGTSDTHIAKKHRPSLQRALSSASRLGSLPASKYASMKYEHLDEESDKENRNPNAIYYTGNQRRSKAAHGKRHAPALKESHTAPIAGSHQRMWNTKRLHISNSAASKTSAVEDDEVRRFMKGGSASGSKDEADMDCIQGLLSLSQGNWK